MKHLIFLNDSVDRPDNEYVGRYIYPVLACHKLGVRIRHITRPFAPQPCQASTQTADAGSQMGRTFSAIALRQVMIHSCDGLESRIADLTGRQSQIRLGRI